MANIFYIKFFIVNKNEIGIGVIPFDKIGDVVEEKAVFIPNDNIDSVYLEKYKFFLVFPGTRLVIKTKGNKVLDLEYNKKK